VLQPPATGNKKLVRKQSLNKTVECTKKLVLKAAKKVPCHSVMLRNFRLQGFDD